MFCPFCAVQLGDAPKFCPSCGMNVGFLTERPSTSSSVGHGPTEDDLIRAYFRKDHSNEIIRDFLESKHGIVMSLKTLKRRLKRLNLSRRANYTPLETVNAAITTELNGSGQLLGYRAMWQTLRQKHSLTVKRDNVMQALRLLNPTGVSLRHRRRFVRRSYCAAGPNQVWHVDGYDKLKPFGIAISGCIDGYSRRVMWLSSGSTNNDPAVIAQHYLQCVSSYGLPARLRTDCGTENGDMAAIHCSLREDHTDEFAGSVSHMYGTSTANQRIESWWSFFRKQRTQFWMDLFSDLRERHYFNGTHEHKCLVRYVFLGIFQKELDEHRELWNNHTIRPVRQSLCPSGKPETMYHLPHRFGGRDCGFPVDPQVLQEFKDLLPPTNSLCGDANLQAYFANLERQSQLAPPINWPAAVDNYIRLKEMAGL
ncbi:uncharacterized protein LOC113098401 [Carassius auratus]|uniref:Uncharacterized protein LOC113098401 n=2 Tax=Carassius auratus TaxID=7957 RepID=A0A6P6PEY3_CARAU|nr:uncharacterized protein LOC113098401 [Carassius auratus]